MTDSVSEKLGKYKIIAEALRCAVVEAPVSAEIAPSPLPAVAVLEEEAVPIWRRVPLWGWGAVGGVILLLVVGGVLLRGGPTGILLASHPTATPIATSTSTATSRPTHTPTATPTNTLTPTARPTYTPYPTYNPMPTDTSTPFSPTNTPHPPIPTARSLTIEPITTHKSPVLEIYTRELRFFPTNTPTATWMPTATPTKVTPQATLCTFRPSDTFYWVWQAEQSRLGCALNEAEIYTAEQPFENGLMFWRGNALQIYVLLQSEWTWQVFPDLWTEDQPLYSCPDVAPPSSSTPLHGFGKVWCEQLGGPSAAIGWATHQELGFIDRWVDCEHGTMLWSGRWSDKWGIFILYEDDGTWQLKR